STSSTPSDGAPTARSCVRRYSANGAELRSEQTAPTAQSYVLSRQRQRRSCVLRDSANGAQYYSQGQARSASPLVTKHIRRRGLKGRNSIPPCSGLGANFH